MSPFTALAALTALAAREGWKDLDGEPAPAIEAVRWFNVEAAATTEGELRGKVVLLAFLGTYGEGSVEKVREYSDLHKRYSEYGLRVIAIFSASEHFVQEELVRPRKPAFWVGADPEGKTEKRYQDRGYAFFPKAYLIDAGGRVVSGEPGEKDVEAALLAAFGTGYLPQLNAGLAAAAALHARGAYGEAWKAAEQHATAPDAALAADAALLRGRIEAHARFLAALADHSLETGLAGRGYGLLLVLSRRFAGLESATAALVKLKGLKAHPEVKKELGAWRDLETVLERDLKPPGAWKAEVMRASYQKVAKANAGTWAGWFAGEREKELAR